jgi:hypothetical protein
MCSAGTLGANNCFDIDRRQAAWVCSPFRRHGHPAPSNGNPTKSDADDANASTARSTSWAQAWSNAAYASMTGFSI